MMMKAVPKEEKRMINLKEMIPGADSIALAGHVRPDGDSVGSTLALYNYIKKLWPEKELVLYLEQPSEKFSYLRGYDEITVLTGDMPDKVYDLFFALDLGDMDRLGNAGKFFLSARDTVCIDHHISNSGFGNHSYIVPESSSTSELMRT